MRIFAFSAGLLALTVGGGVGLSMAHQAAFPTVGPMPTVTSPAPETLAFAVQRTTVPAPAAAEPAALVRAPSIVGQAPAAQQAVLRTPSAQTGADVTPDRPDGDAEQAILDDDNFIPRTRDDDDQRRETIVLRSDPTDFVRTAPVTSQRQTTARSAPEPDFGNLTLIGVYR